jgi:hypothetical protein
MGWPFVAVVAVLTAAYCFCKWLDHTSSPTPASVEEDEDADEDDDEDQDDETT